MKIAGILNSDNYMEFSLRVVKKTAEIVIPFGIQFSKRSFSHLTLRLSL